MLLVADIGNTNITLGLYNRDKLMNTYRMTTWFKRTSDEYGFMITHFLKTVSMLQMKFRMIRKISTAVLMAIFLTTFSPPSVARLIMFARIIGESHTGLCFTKKHSAASKNLW